MKILLFGKDGQVGWELQRSLLTVGDIIASEQHELDFENPDAVRGWVRRHQPDIIVNAAAYTAVDRAESEPDKARRINAEAVGVLAEEANRLDAWLVHYSTDYVFDGEKNGSYLEDDLPNPLSVYGLTKLEGETRIRKRHAKHFIFRTSWVFAARGNNFAKTMLRLAKERETFNVIADHVRLLGTVRCLDLELHAKLPAWIEETVQAICAGYGGEARVRYRCISPPVHNDPELTQLVAAAATELLGRQRVHWLEQPSLGAEDFAELQRNTPATMFRLGVAGPQGCTPLHSNSFAPDEACLAVGVEVLSASLLRWIDARSAAA